MQLAPFTNSCRVLFTLSVEEAVVERFFSLIGRVKPTVRASLGEMRLNTIIRICHENPALENFDATKAMQISCVREKGNKTYKNENQQS